ncbi:phosphatidylserine decarboxylase [Massilia sp. UYP11]|uniref:phophatidylserine decarboxylase associated domain-containing protein n=1 Tax=Massilia sp. UYP11 TaxID=1756385 RepID=UPI003D2265FF
MAPALHDAQLDIDSGPDDPHGGWLPRYGSAAMRTYVARVLGAERTALAPSVQALASYIEDNDVVRRLVHAACADGLASSNGQAAHAGSVPGARIKDLDADLGALLHGLNTVLTHAPGFIDGELIGLPFSAFLADTGRTAGGAALFGHPTFSLLMSNILSDWHAFLDSPASNVGFRIEGEQWLAPEAKERYRFPVWKKDAGTPPYWNSWNAFLTRPFAHPGQARRVVARNAHGTVIFPADGAPVRRDACRSGRTRCAPAELLASPLPQQQALIDEQRLVDLFDGGQVFQASLGPYHVQRWWAPVNGEVLFDPFVIPGSFFAQLVAPDAGGATDSLAGSGHARGVIVIRTEGHGHVCCIPWA